MSCEEGIPSCSGTKMKEKELKRQRITLNKLRTNKKKYNKLN